MGRTCRRGESFPLVPHGRRSAVRPQVRSGCAVFSVGFVLAILAITMIRREAHGWKPIGRRRRLSKTDHTVSGATRSPACSWAGPVLRWALTVRGSLPRWRRSRYKTFSAVISGILTRMPSNQDAPLKTYLDHLARGELAYQFSPEAGRAVFYPRMLCPFTGSDRLEWRISKGLGTVYATTV